MRKYIIKHTAFILLLAVMPMASGYCFNNLFGSMFETKVAQAVSYVNNSAGQTDDCADQTTNDSTAAPISHHDNSILPCCIDGTHSLTTTFSPLIDWDNLITVFFYAAEIMPERVFQKITYQTPIISPPRLLTIKNTILRL